ncbi:unnamed protein product [Cuscuta campestris]|uniref:Uncharacterized protein n=2 Tax=Cuscuta sect. Cleistogrammica TaxID=1824901 RepID=A0A484MMT2_9ASTE|nr:hypothetical protein DM860_007231 [Cuscuta australis]VFQ90162.1 unnamed protein product [Cuscuta campestris]
MNSLITYAVDDNDLDDAALWAVIDSAAAAASNTSRTTTVSTVKHCKPLPVKHSPTVPFPISSPQCSISRNPRKHPHPDGEDFNKSSKQVATINSPASSYRSQEDTPPLALVKHVQRTAARPVYSSPPETRSSVTEYGNCNNSPGSSECSPVTTMNQGRCDDRTGFTRHSLFGQFPTVELFKDYQNAAMAILERSDYTMISGSPYIKKSGWRKISFYFNLSFEIKDKTIEFDENRNVVRAEFVARAYMQGGRFSDGWGSCERREKKFMKPNHDIPSTAETRAKNKACQDLLGIGEYRSGASRS